MKEKKEIEKEKKNMNELKNECMKERGPHKLPMASKKKKIRNT
jgi:hypothetical protein